IPRAEPGRPHRTTRTPARRMQGWNAHWSQAAENLEEASPNARLRRSPRTARQSPSPAHRKAPAGAVEDRPSQARTGCTAGAREAARSPPATGISTATQTHDPGAVRNRSDADPWGEQPALPPVGRPHANRRSDESHP